jgi:hypothetical protein
MNAFVKWVAENFFPICLIILVVGVVAVMITVIIKENIDEGARSDWCYEQGYFEIARTATGKFICVDFRKEKDPTLIIPESVWIGEKND